MGSIDKVQIGACVENGYLLYTRRFNKIRSDKNTNPKGYLFNSFKQKCELFCAPPYFPLTGKNENNTKGKLPMVSNVANLDLIIAFQ